MFGILTMFISGIEMFHVNWETTGRAIDTHLFVSRVY